MAWSSSMTRAPVKACTARVIVSTTCCAAGWPEGRRPWRHRLEHLPCRHAGNWTAPIRASCDPIRAKGAPPRTAVGARRAASPSATTGPASTARRRHLPHDPPQLHRPGLHRPQRRRARTPAGLKRELALCGQDFPQAHQEPGEGGLPPASVRPSPRSCFPVETLAFRVARRRTLRSRGCGVLFTSR